LKKGMKENFSDGKNHVPTDSHPAREKIKLARWQSLADFRARPAHQRLRRPALRISYSFLRNATFFLACALQLFFQPALGGTISGHVHAEGKTGTDEIASVGGDAYDSRKYIFVQRVDYAAMRDFVVYVEGSFGTNQISTNVEQVATTKIAQHEARFTPHVLPVMVGTTVEWPNNDDIYHNVFSYSEAKPFDLGLYKGNPEDKRVVFDKTGKVDVYCSIHTDMHCILLVLDNPYYATTDVDGNYTIQNVPPGTYKLKAWHDRLPPDEQEIIVPTNGVVKADFTLTIKNLPPTGK
jgi:plastocyanin